MPKGNTNAHSDLIGSIISIITWLMRMVVKYWGLHQALPCNKKSSRPNLISREHTHVIRY